MVSSYHHTVRAPSHPPREDEPAGMATHMIAAVLVVAAVLFLAWVRVASLHRGYELGRLRAEQDKLVEENRSLQVEIGTLRAPANLTGIARTRLGMVPPQAAGVVDVWEVPHDE